MDDMRSIPHALLAEVGQSYREEARLLGGLFSYVRVILPDKPEHNGKVTFHVRAGDRVWIVISRKEMARQ